MLSRQATEPHTSQRRAAARSAPTSSCLPCQRPIRMTETADVEAHPLNPSSKAIGMPEISFCGDANGLNDVISRRRWRRPPRLRYSLRSRFLAGAAGAAPWKNEARVELTFFLFVVTAPPRPHPPARGGTILGTSRTQPLRRWPRTAPTDWRFYARLASAGHRALHPDRPARTPHTADVAACDCHRERPVSESGPE